MAATAAAASSAAARQAAAVGVGSWARSSHSWCCAVAARYPERVRRLVLFAVVAGCGRLGFGTVGPGGGGPGSHVGNDGTHDTLIQVARPANLSEDARHTVR